MVYNNIVYISDIGWDKWVETKLFNWNTELTELTFICLDHVGMGFSNLLKRSLDFSDGVTLQVLNFLQGGSNDTKSLWINFSCSQKLVNLSVLGLKRLLDGLMLLLENQVSNTGLLMDFIDKSMEFVK